MIKIISLSAILVGLIACASPGPQADTQTAAQIEPLTVAESGVHYVAHGRGEKETSADSIEIVAVPAATKKATNRASKEDYLICKEELILGSHRKEEVCRYKSEIEAERIATQRELRRASMRPIGNRR